MVEQSSPMNLAATNGKHDGIYNGDDSAHGNIEYVLDGPRHLRTAIKELPVTYQLAPPTDSIAKLEHPERPRVLTASTVDKPQGSPEHAHITNRTVLQQHCDFFDTDGDGVISAVDTFIGFRRIGFNMLTSLLAGFCINFTLSFATSDSWLFDPFLRINLKNIHRGKHGSDSGVYDQQGRFVPYAFESIWVRFDKDKKGGLTWRELIQFVKSHRNALDFAGWAAMCTEWGFTWLLLADVEHGIMYKEDIRAMYDGSIWKRLADERASGTGDLPQRGLTPTSIVKELFYTLRDIKTF